jgi:hypothetical protein
MNKNIKKYIKLMERNGETFNNEFIKKELGVEEVRASAYIKEEHLLIKGEYENKSSQERNAIIVWHNVKKQKIMGK